ncbi:diguanylate cyclase [Mesorhizobium sp. BR1-1-16]|uniref:diguanylate cyclase n=1 Tax=Mesorhizobium sp. BR1-1-16 TaxID=2876653 RepID=UPI001CCFFC02|nr:diguanylate cyclase [Mesorhizobium sp. BR1-1-16]MBZ9936627.1 diguanylate cyclase [Mesorhizobium sp. BR1-1-16]
MSSTSTSLSRLRDAVVAFCARLGAKAGVRDRLSLTIILIVLVTIVATFVTFVGTTRGQAELTLARSKGREQRIVQQALLDLETGARGFSLTGRVDYLRPYIGAQQVLDDNKSIIDRLDQEAKVANPQVKPISGMIGELRASLAALVDRTHFGSADTQQQDQNLDRSKAIMDQLRAYFADAVGQRLAATDQIEERLRFLQRLALVLQLVGGGIILAALIIAFRASSRQAAGRAEAVNAAVTARQEVEHLFAMTDILQSANDYADANAVLVSTARRLLPDFGGALYIFNNSRDRLDLSVAWASGAIDPAEDIPPTIAPDACWAMKRGKSHINETGGHALRCEHATTQKAFLEIPMLARGEIYGLLQIVPAVDLSAPSLADVTPLAVALADGMSLALSSIGLREKLRNQALRDPLTGLHNRRFMEEVLERFVLQAERRGSPIGAIMIDLDHFKRLNDQHGHAIGDAVLRDVAGTLLAALRRTDVACRYGGEELLVLLPDADLAATIAKAEIIRARIADLSSAHGFPITASLGAAAIPETSVQSVDLLKSADAALYDAKHSGRNKVVSAPSRPAIDQLYPSPVERQRGAAG